MYLPSRAGADEPRPRVLYVDDQPGNLTVFKANLKAFVDVATATSGADALALLAHDAYPVVLSDQRMPGMTGAEFLAEVRRRHPETVRILLTGFADFDALVHAVNDGQITRFVRKPWERDDMLATLVAASRQYWRARQAREACAIVDEIETLSPGGVKSLLERLRVPVHAR
ncbi:MAG: response regulator [Myxococcota bacterium]